MLMKDRIKIIKEMEMKLQNGGIKLNKEIG